MGHSAVATTIIQADIDTLLTRLKDLREQIIAAREAVAPLEANLVLANNEFLAAVGHLRRQALQLQAELTILHSRMEEWDQGETQGVDNKDIDYCSNSEPGRMNMAPTPIDAEAVEKDMLLEHLVRVLDHTVNEEDAELLATLQGLCNNPSIRLADILEELPWGQVWMARSPREDMANQHRRLTAWERALANQLNSLKQGAERLQKDSRYGMWQQRQKGPESWRSFLAEAATQQKDLNDRLAIELGDLNKKWEQMVKRA